jgi:hypothetical protein
MLAGKPGLRKCHTIFGVVLAVISIVMSGLAAISINDLRFVLIQ